jgi:DNA-binding beta-propeller fold protein YncE
MWVAIEGGYVVELSPTGAMLGSFIACPNPTGIAFDGTNMWVTNYGSNDVVELSPTGAKLGTFTVTAGNRPQAIAFDGVHMWVANSLTNNVTEL